MGRFAVFLLIVALAIPAFALDLIGSSVQFTWDQGAGTTPEGYRVYVSRDGGEFVQVAETQEQLATVTGAANETVIVAVSAYLGDYESPRSEPSESVTFRELGPPTAVTIHCPGNMREIAPGWWVCE